MKVAHAPNLLGKSRLQPFTPSKYVRWHSTETSVGDYRLDPVFDRTPDGAIKGITRYDIYFSPFRGLTNVVAVADFAIQARKDHVEKQIALMEAADAHA